MSRSVFITTLGLAALVAVAAYGPELWEGSRLVLAIRNALGALAFVLSIRFVLVRMEIIDGEVWSPWVPTLAALFLGLWFVPDAAFGSRA